MLFFSLNGNCGGDPGTKTEYRATVGLGITVYRATVGLGVYGGLGVFESGTCNRGLM